MLLSMKMMAAPVVMRVRKLLAPRLPKTFPLPPPPKTALTPPPRPLWSKMIGSIARQTRTCRMYKAVTTGLKPLAQSTGLVKLRTPAPGPPPTRTGPPIRTGRPSDRALPPERARPPELGRPFERGRPSERGRRPERAPVRPGPGKPPPRSARSRSPSGKPLRPGPHPHRAGRTGRQRYSA